MNSNKSLSNDNGRRRRRRMIMIIQKNNERKVVSSRLFCLYLCPLLIAETFREMKYIRE